MFLNMLGNQEELHSALTLKRKDLSGNENVDTSPEPRFGKQSGNVSRQDTLQALKVVS